MTALPFQPSCYRVLPRTRVPAARSLGKGSPVFLCSLYNHPNYQTAPARPRALPRAPARVLEWRCGPAEVPRRKDTRGAGAVGEGGAGGVGRVRAVGGVDRVGGDRWRGGAGPGRVAGGGVATTAVLVGVARARCLGDNGPGLAHARRPGRTTGGAGIGSGEGAVGIEGPAGRSGRVESQSPAERTAAQLLELLRDEVGRRPPQIGRAHV